MDNQQGSNSTRPYFIRALHEWCCDQGLTPYVAVRVDESVQVPREFVRNDEIVLNISPDATSSLKLGNEFIEFRARFGGVAREVMVPVQRVMAIYARENGQGMAFPLDNSPKSRGKPLAISAEGGVVQESVGQSTDSPDAPTPNSDLGDHPPKAPLPGGTGGRPALKRVK